MVRRRVGSVVDLPDQDQFDPEIVRDLADFGMYQETNTPRATENQFEEVAIEPPIYEDVRQLPLPEPRSMIEGGFEPSEFDVYSQDQLSGLSNLPFDPVSYMGNLGYNDAMDRIKSEDDSGVNQLVSQMANLGYNDPINRVNSLPIEPRDMIAGGYEPPINEEIQAIRDREADVVSRMKQAGYGSGLANFTDEEVKKDYFANPEGKEEWMNWVESGRPDKSEQTVTPDQERAIMAAINNEPPIVTVNSIDKENIPEDAQPVQGAVDVAVNNPEIRSEIERLGGIGEIDADIKNLAKDFERVASLKFEDLNPQEKSLFERMMNGELSTAEKVSLGIAILAPLVIGAMYGAGGLGLGASSALNNFANIAFSQQDTSKKREQFEKAKKTELDTIQDRLKIKKDYLGKTDFNQATKKYLEGRNFNVFGDEVGIGTGDENNVLWINSREIKDDEDVKRMRGVEEEAKKTLGIVNNTTRQVDELEDVLQAIEDKDPGYLDVLANNWSWLGSGTPEKSLASKFAEAPYITVIDKDGKSRQVNALRYAKQIATGLQDNYGKSILKGNKLTQQVLGHWESIFFDPTSLADFRRGGVKGWLESIKGFKNLTNRKIVDQLTSDGFVREPLESKYPTVPMQIVKTGKATQADIARNPEKYKKYER